MVVGQNNLMVVVEVEEDDAFHGVFRGNKEVGVDAIHVHEGDGLLREQHQIWGHHEVLYGG